MNQDGFPLREPVPQYVYSRIPEKEESTKKVLVRQNLPQLIPEYSMTDILAATLLVLTVIDGIPGDEIVVACSVGQLITQ